MSTLGLVGAVLAWIGWARVPLTWRSGTIRRDKQAMLVGAVGAGLLIIDMMLRG